jgi:hypothetical protein
MALLTRDIFVDQGADYLSNVFTYYAGGIAVDLTGVAARMMFRLTPTDSLPLISISTTVNASGQILTGGQAGTLSFTLTKVATTTLTVTSCLWDLYLDWPNGTSSALLNGTVHIRPSVTH